MSLHLEDEINQQYGEKSTRVNALDAKRNPLLISILDAVETLKSMTASGKLPRDEVARSKGLLTMMTNKVCAACWDGAGGAAVRDADVGTAHCCLQHRGLLTVCGVCRLVALVACVLRRWASASP